MQIIEVTDLSARSAMITLTRRESPLQFLVFPMVHLADARFYRAVQQRLANCQIVVVEGVQGASAAARAVTRSYRLLKHKKSLGMIVQQLDYSSLSARIVHPDVTGADFDDSWREIPLTQRMLTAVLVPVFVVWMLLFGSRRVIARHLAMDDLLPTPKQQAEDDLVREKFGETENLIMDRRDELLIHALEQIHHEHSTEPVTVAIVYGAGHVATIVRALHQQFGHIARRGEWLDLFSL